MKIFILAIFLTLSFIFSTFAQNNSPFELTFQPRPEMPEDYGTLDVEGQVNLRVEFMADGQIGKITPVNELTKDLTLKAVEAAKKIKFKPQIKDNQPVTITKLVQYSYSWRNVGWKFETPKFKVNSQTDEKAEAIIKRAVEKLGGERYLQVKTQVSTGNFTPFRDGMADIPNGFIDVISFPDKERTEFKQLGNKIVQTNVGEMGWLFDAGPQTIREQNSKEIESFQQAQRTSLDSLLRGAWRHKNAVLSYVGKREAGIGKRNDVIKLLYTDGFAVEFEFDGTDGMPTKAIFKGKDSDGIEAKEEERYAQFVGVQGILAPFIVDRFIDGKQQSRINYLTIEFNKSVPDSIFAKPVDVKQFKKDLKL